MPESDTPSGLKRAIELNPERWLRIKVATALFVLACTVTCTTYIIRMSDKVDQALAGVNNINVRLDPIQEQNAIMWHSYNRSASNP